MSDFRVSVSDLGYFSSCRRQWYWGLRYQPKLPIPSFFLGSAVHEGLEKYYRSNRDVEAAVRSVATFCDEVLQDVSQNSVSFGGDSANETYEELALLSQNMIRNYAAFDSETPFEGTVVQVEASIRSKILTPEWMHESLTLSGRLDLILQDPSGGIWIVDHKTSSSYTPGLPGLDVDEQLTAYMYLYWRKTGVIPAGVIYNVLLKKSPAPPRVLKNGQLSQDKGQATTYQLYEDEIRQRGLDFGAYAEMLEFLKNAGWSSYFFREAGTRNRAELESFERRFRVKASEIAGIYQDPDTWAYPSPSTYTCNYCQYLSACKSKEDGGDPEAILNAKFKVNNQ